MFGDEETTLIAPAIAACRAARIDASGPYPPDTVFYRAYRGEFDVVVAMTHDHGLIPLKLVHFDDGVNVTMGLPIIRTSVDHGTAYDIAGKGTANPASLLAAVRMAAGMAAAARAGSRGSRPDRRARRPRAQPEEHRRRDPPRPARRDHRGLGLREIVARLRHDLRRGAAAVRGVALRLRPPVPRADGEARRRRDRGALPRHLDRAEVGREESRAPPSGRSRRSTTTCGCCSPPSGGSTAPPAGRRSAGRR